MSAHVFIATSLDGFIARPDGGIDWLPVPQEGDSEDYGYHAFIAGIDAIVMGRNTFELALTFGQWPYERPVVVLSRRGVAIPEALAGKAFAMQGTPEEIVASCAERGWRELYVDGGVTIQGFLRAGLVERMTITRVPVLLGCGLPLFGELAADLHWEHLGTTAYPNGLVQTLYRRRK